MISIIISSYIEKYYLQVCKNIEDTIGVEYEIIKIDNPGKMGITEAYNKGGQMAVYPYLIFCHEDLLFNTKDWGKNLIKVFSKKNANVGLVGVAGSTVKTLAPNSIFNKLDTYNCKNYIQNNLKVQFYKKEEHKNISEDKKVVTVDGMFMATKSEIFEELKFDSLLSGYHAYDLDFSLSIGEKYDVYVMNDISIEHLSLGNFDEQWFNNTIIVNEKWKNKLPIYSTEVPDLDSKILEYEGFKTMMYFIRKFGFNQDFLSYYFRHNETKRLLGRKRYLILYFYRMFLRLKVRNS